MSIKDKIVGTLNNLVDDIVGAEDEGAKFERLEGECFYELPATAKSNVVPIKIEDGYTTSYENYTGKGQVAKTSPPRVYAPKNVRLTIIVIESTQITYNERAKIERILKSLGSSDYITVIRHGSYVSIMECVQASALKFDDIFNKDNVTEGETCFYDALTNLDLIVSSTYGATFPVGGLSNKKYIVDHIDVVGVGTGVDTCSLTTAEMAMERFDKVAKRAKVSTKFFCIDESYFKNVAAIGFQSIGAINLTPFN